jgi:hypothetical protein
VLVHGVGAGQKLAKVLSANGNGQRQANGRHH